MIKFGNFNLEVFLLSLLFLDKNSNFYYWYWVKKNPKKRIKNSCWKIENSNGKWKLEISKFFQFPVSNFYNQFPISNNQFLIL